MKKACVVLLFFCCFISSLSAQVADGSKPFALGITDEIKSKELGEARVVNIYLPADYNPNSDTTYPVIYLLDGSVGEDFVHISGIVQFLTEIVDTMPRVIVVGIANVDRRRDFTFCHSMGLSKEDIPTSGGSARFIAFIEKELQPYISRKYKAGKSAMLIGQSLGGLLASEILLRKPDLFDRYLIVSPSLWWHDESLLTDVSKIKVKDSNKDLRVFIAVGKEGKEMEGDAKKLSAILKASGKKNLKVDFHYMPDENHLTILHNAAYKGLEILFAR